MCKFCESMECNKEVERTARGWATDAELLEYGKWMIEYSVAIVKRSWYQKRGKKSAHRTIQFRNKGFGYKLKYCPECGKEL